jgi:hypothetical protein
VGVGSCSSSFLAILHGGRGTALPLILVSDFPRPAHSILRLQQGKKKASSSQILLIGWICCFLRPIRSAVRTCLSPLGCTCQLTCLATYAKIIEQMKQMLLVKRRTTRPLPKPENPVSGHGGLVPHQSLCVLGILKWTTRECSKKSRISKHQQT